MSIKNQQYIFLLGGYDLEMVEIKNILISQNQMFIDKHLVWGAKLSCYQSEFDEYHTFVGIELIQDIVKPLYYLEIDHHNENVNLPSSLEQVAHLLGVELTFYQRLVAANDKGYIPEMLKLGATKTEIDQIRLNDRKAQGVTENDEQLALKSIDENLLIQNGVTIIKSLTNKFSTITDRRFGIDIKLLVYTDKNLCYYGAGISKLTEKYIHLIESKKAYYGGGEKGFFGIADFVFSVEEIENEIIPKIIITIENE